LYGLSQNRISDIAILNELAADAAEITHQHPLGYIPAYIASHIIYRLAIDEEPTREAFGRYVYEALQQATQKYSSLKYEMDIIQTLLDKALVLANKNISDHKAIKEIGEGWVAEETLAIAIYCVGKYFNDFEKALIASVNHGGDSDSTGAVTGNILGAAIGYEAIPEHFKTDLQLHDVILHVADDLWRGYTTRFIK
jgi:ADP-ribosylglycohydrolase